ncbi:MAG: efflux transporter outer membrane subunit [Verrucomicrobiae bacterium]|nr:efflux transporter outer membrane subunit [Verrucomicrobiae bacterium]
MSPNPIPGGRRAVVLVAFVSLLGTLLMSGCLPESDLAAMVESGAAYGESGGAKGSLPDPGDWWKNFDDAGLETLLKDLRSENPGLKAALARFDQSRAAFGVAESDFFPAFYGDGHAKRLRDTGNSRFVLPQLTYSQYRAALNLNWELDLWGRVRKSVDAARAEMEASAADLDAAQLSLEAELARNYYQWRFTNEELRVLDRTVDLRQENVDLVDARVRGGETNQLDLDRARTELEATRAQKLQVERARAELEHAIAVLVGEAPATFEFPGAAKHSGVGKVAVVPAGVPSDLLSRRPDVAAAESRLAAAASRLGATKRSYLPTVTLTGLGGLQGVDTAKFFDPVSLFGEIGPQVQVPLFQGGRIVGDVERADAEAREALASYEEVVLGAFQDVEDALSGIRFLDREIAAHDKAAEAAKSAAALSRKRYEGGLVSYLEVVDAERTALNEERELIRARSTRHLASVQLIQALGGGWAKAKAD